MTSAGEGRARPGSPGGEAASGEAAATSISTSIPMSAASATEQALLYANDLAILYRRVREDGARLARLEERLGELARISLELIDAPSADAAGERVSHDVARALDASRVAVYVMRTGRLRLLATHGEPPTRSSITREELGELGRIPVARASAFEPLRLDGPLVLVPFAGRGSHLVGFAVAQCAPPAAEALRALELLARFVAVLLESHLVQESSLEARRTQSQITLRPQLEKTTASPLDGESTPMQRVRKLVQQVASVSSSVLVLGATGTGKELVARAIHDASARKKGPFVAVNCGALPESLAESEIFGHEAGAFTGAQKRHRGKVELANGGTLFLDELGEMPRAVQVKLLRFLQDSRYQPLGSETERASNVRVIAATNKNLAAAVASGDFREDLLFRLNVFTIDLPPLRERGDDVILLANRFAREVAAESQVKPPVFTEPALAALRAYAWPGNVRELRNVVERAVILSRGGEIDGDLLPGSPEPREPVPGATIPIALPAGELKPFGEAKADLLARFEASYCEAALDQCGWNVTQAARLAHMDKKNLHRKINEYGLVPKRFNASASGAPRADKP
jgi:DNA-binding NtrC family response regulator